jgi:hypothetical protein
MRAILIACLMISATVRAQGVFRDVTAVQFGDSIMLNWTLTGGSTCFDMHLQRSDASNAFTTIFSVPGVCGGSSDQYYAFIDHEDLESGVTYQYRITASNDLYASDTVSITYIDAGGFTLFMYPNPANDFLAITIDNSLTPSFLVEVFDLSGRRTSISTYPSNLIQLPISELSPGVYNLLVTTREGEHYAADFIVQ